MKKKELLRSKVGKGKRKILSTTKKERDKAKTRGPKARKRAREKTVAGASKKKKGPHDVAPRGGVSTVKEPWANATSTRGEKGPLKKSNF